MDKFVSAFDAIDSSVLTLLRGLKALVVIIARGAFIVIGLELDLISPSGKTFSDHFLASHFAFELAVVWSLVVQVVVVFPVAHIVEKADCYRRFRSEELKNE